MTHLDIATDLLVKHEGERFKAYKCPAGKRTIGIGHNLDDNGLPPSVAARMTLSDILANGIDHETSREIFAYDLAIAERDAKQFAGLAWESMNNARRAALIDMAFQLGLSRLSGFKGMRKAMQTGNWNQVAYETLDSKYAQRDTPARAREIAQIFKTGVA